MSKKPSSGTGSKSRKKASPEAVAHAQAQRRKVVVFTSLTAVLTLTSAVLMALAPAPLTPAAASSLFAVDAPASLDVVFQTKVPVTTDRQGPARWKYIYLHHSRTPAGDAMSLGQQVQHGSGDHFVICNGDGAVDGEIQVTQRWNQQLPPAAPKGAGSIDPSFISICLVGDFDHTVPTPTQLRRATQLVSTLQSKLRIGRDAVVLLDQPTSAAGIGKYFPAGAFREQLLP